MKRFLIKLSYTIFPLWLFFIGLVIYHNIVVVPNMRGDLAILGNIPMKLWYDRTTDKALQDTILYSDVKKAETLRSTKCDVLTCGDSFSLLGLYGYQNYLSHGGFHVLNYAPKDVLLSNPFQNAYNLMRLGYVDSTNVKVLIVESVERCLSSRVSGLDFENYMLNEGEETDETRTPRGRQYLTEANNFLLLRCRKNPVIKFSMSDSLFSGERGNDLYVYKDDLYEFSIHDSVRETIHANVGRLFAEAESKGVKLIMLVCPDKFDVYQDYVMNNPHPRKRINEDFREIVGDRDDVFIAKEILSPYVSAREKDLFYFDDTHWTCKSAKIISDTLTKYVSESFPKPYLLIP